MILHFYITNKYLNAYILYKYDNFNLFFRVTHDNL